jgi:hypothetical protein
MPKTNLDRPTTDDRLNFSLYVQPIVRTIQDAARNNQLPLTIGIYGRWGSGKTSLMMMVEKALDESLERKALKERVRQLAKKATRRLTWILAIWGLVLLVGVFLSTVIAPRAAHWGIFSEATWQVFWFSAWFGGLGGLLRSTFDVWLHGVVEADLDPQHPLFLAFKPLMGMIVGTITFLVFIGASGWGRATTYPGLLVTLVYLLVFTLGLSWDETVYTLIQWLIRLFRERQEVSDDADPKGEKSDQQLKRPDEFQVIWFNAWRFAEEDELWAALLQEVLRQVKVNAEGVDRLRIKWQLWKRSIEWESGFKDVVLKLLPTTGKTLLAAAAAAVGGWLADLAVRSAYGPQLGQAAGTASGLLVGLGSISTWLRTNVSEPLADVDFEKYRKKSSYKDHLTFMAEFNKEFRDVTRIARGEGNPLVIMLDDLDRCLPEKAVSVLEAIKLFSDDAPVVFIIGADREFIERAIEIKYEKMIRRDDPNLERRERFIRMGHEYLEKIVQLPFNLPPIERTLIDKFIDDTFSDVPNVMDVSHIFSAGLLPNPRQVLRVIGIFRFVTELAEARGDIYTGAIHPDILAKLVIVQYRFPDLFVDLVERPSLLAELEWSYQLPSPVDLEGEFPESFELIKNHSNKRGLRRLLTVPEAESLADVDLGDYIFITARAQSQPESAKEQISQVLGVEEALPEDFNRLELEADVANLNNQVDELVDKGADAAVLNRLRERLASVEYALRNDDLKNVVDQLPGIRSLISTAQERIQAREGERVIAVQATEDGRLIFQRALSYEPVEVLVESNAYLEKINLTTYASFGPPQETVIDFSKELWVATRKFTFSDASDEMIIELSNRLGTGLQNVLGDLTGNVRLRVLTENPDLDELPWELATLTGDKATPRRVGLDPRFSVVRGVPLPPVKSVLGGFSLDREPLSMVVVRGDQGPDCPTDVLSDIEFPIPVEVILAPDRVKLTNYLQEEQPAIVHLCAHPAVVDGDPGIQFRTPQGDQQLIHVKDLVHGILSGSAAQLVVLDMPRGREIIRLIAEARFPMVVGWQSTATDPARNAFYYAFYNAFLRTGQVDFAITEGRRSIATALGTDSTLAVSPVLYLSESGLRVG